MPTDSNGKNRKSTRPDVRLTPVSAQVAADIQRIHSEVLCVAEAAARLKLSKNTVRKYCQHGIFQNAGQFGCDWMIPMHDVIWWEQNRKGKVGRPKREDN